MSDITCFKCGACCVALDISTLGKAAGVPCEHLSEDNSCGIYDARPWVCRAYKADEVCVSISHLSFDERVRKLTEVYA